MKTVNFLLVVTLVNLTYVPCNSSPNIHNKGDCYDVIGHHCPAYVGDEVECIGENNPIKCVKEAAICDTVSQSKDCGGRHETCKWVYNQEFLPYMISMDLNCSENKNVSVLGAQFLIFKGSVINIKDQCCINDQSDRKNSTNKCVQNLSNDDFLLLYWYQECEGKHKCTIKVPRWQIRFSDTGNVEIPYTNHCEFHDPSNVCFSYRMNVQYQCLPEEDLIREQYSKKGNNWIFFCSNYLMINNCLVTANL